jgi:hypothetical protein
MSPALRAGLRFSLFLFTRFTKVRPNNEKNFFYKIRPKDHQNLAL